jgi:hypothetical protein
VPEESETMKTISGRVLILLLVLIMVGGVSCVLEDKVIEIVVTGTTCVEYEESEDSETFVTPAILDYGDEIQQILEDNDLDRSDIESAVVSGASYTVTDFSHTHDWEISGEITVERTDVPVVPEVLITYTNVSLEQSLGATVPAVLEPAGVAILDEALQDFLEGANPTLILTVVSGGVEPDPSGTDVLVFVWRACITIHVMMSDTYEVPDVF